ncbi:Fc.00g113820.m01.CDS01 [Cosmosporella sp. VM-42]
MRVKLSSYLFAHSRRLQSRAFSVTMTQLKKRAVAGSFIFKFPNDDTTKKPQVALFRRSGEVSTYQHKYAPISGSIEESDPSPLGTAWRELQEETTLTATSLRLFRQGKPYSFVDESISREWTINPFGFVLKSAEDGGKGEAGIQLDWEHEGYAWFDPGQVNESESFEGVPRILESLRRVWFNIDLGESAGATLGDGLIALQRDHESGAHQLATRALEIFVNVIKKLDTSSHDLWWKNVRFAGWHLWKNGRESMGASILTVVLSSLAIIEEKLPGGPLASDFTEDIVAALRQYAQLRAHNSSKISAEFGKFLGQHFPEAEVIKILTLSASSTITSCITDALKQNISPLDIRVLESRPLFEGVKMADAIASFASKHPIKTDVTLYTDASAGIAAKDVDLVIIGTDLLDKSGNVSNKTGSLPAVLSSKYISPGAKVIALSGKEKILPFEPPELEDNDSEEVVQTWGQSVPSSKENLATKFEVKNVPFEWVPSDLIDHYVTEDGVASSEGIANWAQHAHEKADRFFAGL